MNQIEENFISVYCKVDKQNHITAVNSSIFLADTDGWLELDRSDSGSRANRDAYAHAQGNYLLKGLTDDTGAHRYLYDETATPKYREATLEEMQAERESFPSASPAKNPIETLQEENRLLKAQLSAASDRQDFLEDCIAEMAAQVYNA